MATRRLKAFRRGPLSWSAATVVLLCGIAALCLWMYTRDLGAVPLPPEQGQAQLGADKILARLAPPSGCAQRCLATLLSRIAPEVWHVKVTTPSGQRCFVLDLHAFSESAQHGLTGVRPAQCGDPVPGATRKH